MEEITNLMPFEKFSGMKVAVENVPAEYLLWLYENSQVYGDVKAYIEKNLDVIKEEIELKTQ